MPPVSLTIREHADQDLRRRRSAEPRAARALHAGGRRGARRALRRPPPGYSQPIGGGIAYEGYVSPSGVGYDIGCGNKAARTDLPAAEVDVPAVMREITRRISFGMGVPAQERVDHPVLEKVRTAEFEP